MSKFWRGHASRLPKTTMRIESLSPICSAFPPRAAAPAGPPAAGTADSVSLGQPFDLQARLASTAEVAANLEPKLQNYVPGELLVKLGAGTTAQAIEGFAADYGASVTRRIDMPAEMAARFEGELIQLRLPPTMSTAQAMAAMAGDGRVAYAEPNFRIKTFERKPPKLPPTDLTDLQWNLRNSNGVDIKALDAWKISTGVRENGPVVAVLDTGIDYNHPDLASNMWTNPDPDLGDPTDGIYGTNLVEDTGDPLDDHNHGTHCAGIIGAAANNGGVVGVNWNTNLMAVKVLDSQGMGDTADAVAALAYATKKGARITNNSWGTDEYSQAMKDALAASPALHICSAGNDGWDNDTHPSYPGSFDLDNVISVASHNRRNQLAPSSNRGASTVHIAAPGVAVHSTLKQGQWGALSGTSMAAPHVAGVAALIASKYPEADNATIKTRILHSVDRMPSNDADLLISKGRLNAGRALTEDSVAPAAMTDFSARALDPGTVELRWTASGDDGTQGSAVRYELRYSHLPIAVNSEVKPGEVGFQDALPAPLEAPLESGRQETARVDVRPSGKEQKLYWALRAIDKVGNPSAISLSSVTLPAGELAFEEPEDGASRFTPEGSWGLISLAGRGRVWTDSPEGGYVGKRNDSLTSTGISLKEWKNPVLSFDAKVNTEKKYDTCEVEVYGRKWWGGTKWRSVASLSGIHDWKGYQVSLSEYEGQDIKIRFRFRSDDSRDFDGVYLDNVVISGRQDQVGG